MLKTIAHPSQGGLGYKIKFFNPALDMDGYEVDHQRKEIQLDTSGVFSNHSAKSIAKDL